MSKRNRNESLDESDDDDVIQTRKNKNRVNAIIDSDDESNNDGTSDVAKTSENDNGSIDLTANLKIQTSKKNRSSHPIWDMFGNLEKNGKVLEKAKNRIFCVHCFRKKKMKR